jgi:flagellar basal body-associated protein FliL
MADKQEPKKDDKQANAAEAPKKSKKGLMMGVGAVVVVALGSIGAMMAVPKKAKEEKHLLAGPFISKLSKNEIQANLSGEASKRYLVMELNVEYFAYEEAYVTERLGTGAAGGEHGGAASEGDALYLAMLKDSLLEITARKTRDQVTDSVQIDAFLEEVRVAVDPLLFPVCLGDSHRQNMPDTKSGLRLGESITDATFRGMLHEHELLLDATAKTVQLDEGPVVKFEGNERDLRVEAKDKTFVYLDVSTVLPEFVGAIPIGIAGKVRRVYREKFLVQ